MSGETGVGDLCFRPVLEWFSLLAGPAVEGADDVWRPSPGYTGAGECGNVNFGLA